MINVRQVKREATRSAILDEAMTMVVEGGLEAVSINQLAKKVGYTPGALYSYFPSRDALLVQLQGQIFRELTDVFAADMQRMDQWGRDAQLNASDRATFDILVIALFYVGACRAHPGKYRFLSQMAGDPKTLVQDDLVDVAISQVIPVLGSVVQRLTQLHQTHQLPTDTMFARAILLLASLQGLLQAQKLLRLVPATIGGPELSTDTLVARLLEDQLTAWGIQRPVFRQAYELALQASSHMQF